VLNVASTYNSSRSSLKQTKETLVKEEGDSSDNTSLTDRITYGSC